MAGKKPSSETSKSATKESAEAVSVQPEFEAEMPSGDQEATPESAADKLLRAIFSEPEVKIPSDGKSETTEPKADTKFYKGGVSGVKLEEGKNNPAYQGEAQGLLSEDERKNILGEAFQVISELPDREVERLTALAKKRLEKWSDDIPKVAPELYQDRRASEGLPDFLRRVYGSRGYLNGKMTTAHLDILNPPVATAIRSWVNQHGSLPNDINVPNKVNRPKGMKYNKK